MSDAAALGADIPAGDLEGLRRAVCKRAAWEAWRHHDDRETVWPTLATRMHRVSVGQNMTGVVMRTHESLKALHVDLEADLRGLLALPVDQFVRCFKANATNPGNRSPQAEIYQAEMRRVQMHTPPLPRVQPTELLQRLAGAGIIVQAVDGNLHVQPAELLSDADRAALVANKASLIEALTRPAAVL